MADSPNNIPLRFESLMPIAPAGPDLELAIAFYEKFLGFQTCFREGSPPHMAIIRRDGVEIMLQRTDDQYWASQTSYRIRVAGVEAFYREFESRGGPIHPHGKLQKKPWGATEFSATDPFGVCLTFYEFPQ